MTPRIFSRNLVGKHARAFDLLDSKIDPAGLNAVRWTLMIQNLEN